MVQLNKLGLKNFRRTIVSVSVCLMLPSFVTLVCAQQRPDGQALTASELAKDNLDRVAASRGDDPSL